nr:MAG TPA: hypothetical protein [Caudoviricetes sp.]
MAAMSVRIKFVFFLNIFRFFITIIKGTKNILNPSKARGFFTLQG